MKPWTWMLALWVAGSAAAAVPPEPSGTTAAARVPRATATPALSPAAAELIRQQKRIASLQGAFVLTVEGAEAPFIAQGRVQLAPGRKYRVEYLEPEYQLLVSNGKQRWLYLKKINQVQKQTLPPAGNPSEFFLELGGGLPDLLKRCRVRPETAPAPGLRQFLLTPRPGSGLEFESARLVQDADGLPVRVTVRAQRVVTVEFKNVVGKTRGEPGTPAAAEDPFEFKVPAGAEVIEPLFP